MFLLWHSQTAWTASQVQFQFTLLRLFLPQWWNTIKPTAWKYLLTQQRFLGAQTYMTPAAQRYQGRCVWRLFWKPFQIKKKLLCMSGRGLIPELYTITPIMPCLFLLTVCKLITTSPNQLHPTAHEWIPLACWQFRNIFLGCALICEYTYMISPVHHVSAMLNYLRFSMNLSQATRERLGSFNYFTSDE